MEHKPTGEKYDEFKKYTYTKRSGCHPKGESSFKTED